MLAQREWSGSAPIVHLVPAISLEANGPLYVARRLCEVLREHGTEVLLATLDWKKMPDSPELLKLFPFGIGPRRLGRSPAMSRWLQAQARGGAIRLLHNHGLWMMPNVYPGRIAKRYNVPYIVSPHGTLSGWAMRSGSSVKRAFWPLVQRPSLAAVTCWHATSEAEYADIRRLGFRQPVAIIPNGVDVLDLAAKRDSDFRTLLFLGRIHPIKGLDLLLPAWRAVQDHFRDWRLVIAGPDSDGYLARMRGLANELKVQRVEFVGPLYGREKWLAYRDADLFVLPSYSENFGIAVAEALAAGTPAIVTRGAPWAELEKKGTGWWIDIGVEPLAACLRQAMAASPEHLANMGRVGREWMQSQFSWAMLGQRMEAVYDWMLAGGPRPIDVVVD